MPGLAVKLIVGLGNPGRDYETSRHNAGFWVVEELARRHGGAFRAESKFNAELARTRIGGHELWLVKPQDYMNNSGRVTAAVATFYKVEPAQLLVVHDELDLPAAEVRLKEGGGSGGHNGLKDLIAHLGDGFWRLRLGVGHPGAREEVTPWLLSRSSAAQREELEPGVSAAADIVPVMIEQGPAVAMQKLHSRASPPKDSK
jgi:PTH1 family peptidyl-tRNA hydrolase